MTEDSQNDQTTSLVSPSDQPFVLPLMENEQALNLRWRAAIIVIVREETNGGKLSRSQYDEIARDGSVGTGRSLQRYVEMIRKGAAPENKKPPGRPPIVSEQVHMTMTQKAQQMGYHFTHQLMADLVKSEIGIGSKSTIRRVLKKKLESFKASLSTDAYTREY